jgi:hypothetical protein
VKLFRGPSWLGRPAGRAGVGKPCGKWCGLLLAAIVVRTTLAASLLRTLLYKQKMETVVFTLPNKPDLGSPLHRTTCSKPPFWIIARSHFSFNIANQGHSHFDRVTGASAGTLSSTDASDKQSLRQHCASTGRLHFSHHREQRALKAGHPPARVRTHTNACQNRYTKRPRTYGLSLPDDLIRP